MRLFEATDAILRLESLIERIEEQETPDEEARGILYEALAATGKDQAEGIEALCKVHRQAEAEAGLLKGQIDDWTAKRRVLVNRSGRIKSFLGELLGMMGQTKVAAGLFTVRIQQNGGKHPLAIAPEIEAGDQEALRAVAKEHPEYVRLTIDLEAVRADLEAGVSLEFARLEERGSHVRIV